MYKYTIIYHKRVKFVNKNMLMGNKNVTFLAFTKRTHRLHKTVAICVLFSVRFIPNRVRGICVGYCLGGDHGQGGFMFTVWKPHLAVRTTAPLSVIR